MDDTEDNRPNINPEPTQPSYREGTLRYAREERAREELEFEAMVAAMEREQTSINAEDITTYIGPDYTERQETDEGERLGLMPLEIQMNIARDASRLAQQSIDILRNRQLRQQHGRMGELSLQGALEIRAERPVYFRQLLDNQLAYEATGREVRRMGGNRDMFRRIENRLAGIYRDGTSDPNREGNTTATIGQE